MKRFIPPAAAFVLLLFAILMLLSYGIVLYEKAMAATERAKGVGVESLGTLLVPSSYMLEFVVVMVCVAVLAFIALSLLVSTITPYGGYVDG